MRVNTILTVEEFNERWGNVKTPEEIDWTFSIQFLTQALRSVDGGIDETALRRSMPEKFYDPMERILAEVEEDDVDSASQAAVKVYEKLMAMIHMPELYLPSSDFHESVEKKAEMFEDKYVEQWYAEMLKKYPKHVVDILRLCGNYILKPVTDDLNSFTYMNIDVLAEEIQGIIDECKMGS